MKPLQRRERQKAEVQRRILDAARELFSESGIDAVTMRAIADRIEYTPAALYFHFRDKEALVTRLCAEDYAALGGRFRVLERVPDPMERIRMVARTYVAFALEHPHHYRLVFLSPRPGMAAGDGAAEATAPERLIEAHLLRAVTEASDSGLFRRDAPPPAWIARALWEGMHGLVSLEVVGRGRTGGKRGEASAVPSALDRLETMMTLLWRGVARAAG